MSVFRTDDPLMDFDRYDMEMERRLARRPKCALCGEHIQEETAVYIYGEWICDVCLEEHRKEIEDDEL